MEGRDYKGHKTVFMDTFHYLNCGTGFTGAYIYMSEYQIVRLKYAQFVVCQFLLQ